MKTIKFSHRYTKMPRDFRLSKLLAVLPVKLEELGLDFILYDTSYLDMGNEKQYPLPSKGDYMILLLQANRGGGALWTTIRSQKGRNGIDKMSYYQSLVGNILECVIVE
jgi:hypothetical protein